MSTVRDHLLDARGALMDAQADTAKGSPVYRAAQAAIVSVDEALRIHLLAHGPKAPIIDPADLRLDLS